MAIEQHWTQRSEMHLIPTRNKPCRQKGTAGATSICSHGQVYIKPLLPGLKKRTLVGWNQKPQLC